MTEDKIRNLILSLSKFYKAGGFATGSSRSISAYDVLEKNWRVRGTVCEFDAFLHKVAFVLLLALVIGTNAAAASNKRVEVPISQRRLSDGETRFSIPVSIGGNVPIEAMLDTGSFGLRVMSGTMAPGSYRPLNIERQIAFASGVQLRGVLVSSTISIGTAVISTPIVVQLVKSVGCIESKPDCPASMVAADDYRIGGDGLAREGYWAIIGLSMASPDITPVALNPLLFIGAKRWIIILPLPGQAGHGKLIINPSNVDLSGFRFFPVADLVSNTRAIAGAEFNQTAMASCPDQPRFERDLCVSSNLDTGSDGKLMIFYHHAIYFDYRREMVGLGSRN